MSAARRVRTRPIEGLTHRVPVSVDPFSYGAHVRNIGGHRVEFVGYGAPVVFIRSNGEHHWMGDAPKKVREARA